MAGTNPANGITKINKSDGFHSWREEELETFRFKYPLGTTARLAFELMLNLGVRRSDLVALGARNLVNGRVEFRPSKSTGRDPRPLISLPLTAELLEVLALTDETHRTFLVTEYGDAFTSNGFGNKMPQWCDDAGLPHCSSHGLRKASATLLAEAGATEHQLMAIFGWSDSKTAQHYTKAAQSKKVIDAGFERRKNYLARRNVPLSERRSPGETKRGKDAAKTTSGNVDGGPGGTSAQPSDCAPTVINPQWLPARSPHRSRFRRRDAARRR
ncbi:tyrosine-type recombinase/integrase [Ensifer adhaerens]|uniref:tyrosine-type recombinase/integrase n=1 Tax=Ensifer adhaerens TaxID=106592 RepID=UPI001F2224AA|nr:site-specific integrase [Ensifer adhaerens]MDF8358993.1 site-specific integrase [Ensifer adhaerens]